MNMNEHEKHEVKDQGRKKHTIKGEWIEREWERTRKIHQHLPFLLTPLPPNRYRPPWDIVSNSRRFLPEKFFFLQKPLGIGLTRFKNQHVKQTRVLKGFTKTMHDSALFGISALMILYWKKHGTIHILLLRFHIYHIIPIFGEQHIIVPLLPFGDDSTQVGMVIIVDL